MVLKRNEMIHKLIAKLLVWYFDSYHIISKNVRETHLFKDELESSERTHEIEI